MEHNTIPKTKARNLAHALKKNYALIRMIPENKKPLGYD